MHPDIIITVSDIYIINLTIRVVIHGKTHKYIDAVVSDADIKIPCKKKQHFHSKWMP